MNKPIISISINDSIRQFEIEEHFQDFSVDELCSIIGFLTALIHQATHFHAEKQNEWVKKQAKLN